MKRFSPQRIRKGEAPELNTSRSLESLGPILGGYEKEIKSQGGALAKLAAAVARLMPPAILGKGSVWDVRSFGTIQAAATYLGSRSGTLYITNQQSIPATFNFASLCPNISIHVLQGGSFNVASGQVLTLSKLEAGDYRIFQGAGSIAGLKKARVAWYGAAADGVADDAPAFNLAIASGAVLIAPKGTYRWASQVTLNLSTGIKGAGEGLTIFSSDHTGSALKITTNNKPILQDFRITRATIGAVGSRTGILLDVDPSGDSVQVQGRNVWLEGGAIGLKLKKAFLSQFDCLTLKRNDINYHLGPSTNNSIVFRGCAANLLIRQHIVADGDTLECGATFEACEFENATYMPSIHIKSGEQGGFLQLRDAYLYENNDNSNGDGSSFLALIKSDVPSNIQITGGGISAGAEPNARNIMLTNPGALSTKYHVVVRDTLISSDRSVSAGSAPIDMDGAILTDFTHKIVVEGNRYNNTNGTPYPTICDRDDTQRNNEFFGIRKLRGLKLLNQTGTEIIDSESTGSTRWLGSTYLRNHHVFFDGSISWHVWVSAQGQLRIKDGAPASDTDGDPAAYIIPKLQGQQFTRFLTAADYATQQWLSTIGSSTGETQLGAAASTGKVKFGIANNSANYSYSAKSDASRYFTVTSFAPRMAIPWSTFTIGANTYTVKYSDDDRIYVVEAISGEAAAGTLTAVKASVCRMYVDLTKVHLEASDLVLATAGKGVYIKEGSNATMGTATLVAGSASVSTTKVTGNSRIFLQAQNSSGTAGELTISARVAGTSFTITSASGADTRAIAWMIIEPAP